ncbi:MgtC/SapB family protein [Hungatella effluvii]|uniref:MgtC/SapB family protein n=1 Tax=Hungatella effluvii TaxID=1096246 RepID=UPI002A7EC9D2|nr:MgtC/SapB family protein [Hungatella effluvii]
METVTAAVEYLEGINLASITMRIVMSMVCGGVIGIERGKAHQPAGMRTYMLVCMGAAMVMLTGQYMYYHFQTGDPARLGAQVVSGIGFLGAGSIIISGKTKIKGLTTAAGLWTAACIGLSIGIGFYEAGIIATLAVSLIMTQLKKLEYHLIFDDVCSACMWNWTTRLK